MKQPGHLTTFEIIRESLCVLETMTALAEPFYLLLLLNTYIHSLGGSSGPAIWARGSWLGSGSTPFLTDLHTFLIEAWKAAGSQDLITISIRCVYTCNLPLVGTFLWKIPETRQQLIGLPNRQTLEEGTSTTRLWYPQHDATTTVHSVERTTSILDKQDYSRSEIGTRGFRNSNFMFFIE